MRSSLPAVLATIALAALGGCGEDTPPQQTTVTVSAPQSPASTSTTVPAPTASGEADGTGPAESATDDPRVNALERSAARTVRRYIEALNARDGAAVCELLAPGAIEEVELPVDRGSCAASVTASIGYRDPRGLPVWAGTEITSLQTEIDGPSARVLADIVTEFADRGQASIEDDIVYLTLSGQRNKAPQQRRGSATPRWLLTKPSATLYRAVGIADVPVTVLSPPD